MDDPKLLLYDMLLDEFSKQPGFLLARNLFLFCHFNPAFELPPDVMQEFIEGLMKDNLRAFGTTYSFRSDGQIHPSADTRDRNNAQVSVDQQKKRDIYNEITAERLTVGTGRTYTPRMVDEIPRKFRGIESYNEMLELFIMASAQKKSFNWELSEFTSMLKTFPVFSPLSESDLQDLFPLLRFRRYNPNELILRKGDPGTHLYIVLTGKVEVVGDNNESITFLESGSVFGEMSLLTGAPVATSVYSRGVTKLATLTVRDFKHVLHKYPVLHVFFYGLLIERTGKPHPEINLDTNTGMSGDLANVNVVELFQMINSSQKTGTVRLKFKNGTAEVYFRDGELVYAREGELKGRRAVFSLLGRTEGLFMYSPGIPSEAEEYEIIGGFMGLVMEGMQRLDEEAPTAAG